MDLSPHRVPPEPSWRKPVGMLLIILYITLYALSVSALADSIAALPLALEAIVYLVAGLAWIAPLRPFILWMNTGRWSTK
ncbi:DUF2842 domain-containing protein [Sandarakinorhabdus rubra]|uniref:DUF2842 domain-containing protein n=1 Tax=Sandarakinorhabdus rubra TaxID=2672568 RepID=UPI0013DB0AB2|nr:DUF2842 domain-containing protein [Sandarakinorhabdus rubra]